MKEESNTRLLFSDRELAQYLHLSVPTARLFAEEVGAVRHFGRARRTDRRVIEAALAQKT